MKLKILLLSVVLALVGGSYYLMAAVPTQPRVSIDAAVESGWDKALEYEVDLNVGDSISLNIGGIDTVRIVHLKSRDTTNAGVYLPFLIYMDWNGSQDTLGQFTELLVIGAEIGTWQAGTNQIFIQNPSATDTVTVKVLVIGQ